MKKAILILTFLFMVLISPYSDATSLGLRSNNLVVSLNFEPNMERTYSYSVLTYDSSLRDIGLYVVDDDSDGTTTKLAQYFTLSDTVLKNVDDKREPYFTVTMRLPDKIPEPGSHKVRVGAVELIGNGGGIGVRTAIEALFFINVPYPGQYLQYSLETNGVNAGQRIPYKLHLNNLGTDTINKLNADIELFDSSQRLAVKTTTKTINMSSRETRTLEGFLETSSLPPGEYSVNATINYDGKQEHAEQNVKIGELSFKILNQTEEIISGKINKIQVEVESEWADRISNVFADIRIGDRPVVKTVSDAFEGFQKKTLEAFFDANGLAPGIYDMVIDLHYGNGLTSKITKVIVVKQSKFDVPKLNLSLGNVLLMIIVAMILIINIVLFVLLLKKKDEDEKKK